MPPPSRAASDAVSELHDAEKTSLLCAVTCDLPAMAKCSDHLRGMIEGLCKASAERQKRLAAQLRAWREEPHAGVVPPADPFFKLLSNRFFLLKVAEAQAALHVRYTNARGGVGGDPMVSELLDELGAEVAEGLARFDRELAAMGLERPSE